MRQTLHIPLALLFLALPAAAQAPEAPEPAGRGQRLDRAKALHDEADAIRRAAEEVHAQAQKTCWERILVSACHDSAKKALREETARARKLDQEAREIEREVKKQDLAEREAKRAEEAPRKAAEAAEQAEKNRQAREEAMARVARKQAEAARQGR